MKRMIIITLLLAATGSCTIQKRLYTGGWNVEWKHHNTAAPANQDLAEVSRIDEMKQPGINEFIPSAAAAAAETQIVVKELAPENSDNHTVAEIQEAKSKAWSVEETEQVFPLRTNQINVSRKLTVKKERLPLAPSVRPARIFGLLACALVIALTLLLIINTFPGAGLLYLVSIGLGITSLVFARKARKERRNNPGKYRQSYEIFLFLFQWMLITAAIIFYGVQNANDCLFCDQ